MSREIILTAAVNGGNPKAHEINANLPVSPVQIAQAIDEAAELGAAIAHFHVRDPQTGLPSNDPALYREVVERVRDSGTDILLNITCSMDGMVHLDGNGGIGAETTWKPAQGRVAHVLDLKPAIATMDCGTFAVGDAIHVARTCDLTQHAQLLRQAGIKPEVECFDFGHLETALRMMADGAFASPPFFQICLGTAYGGAPATREALHAMQSRMPPEAEWAAFAAGADNLWVMEAAIAGGGHIRTGLEDTLLTADGEPATNAGLLLQARDLVERLGDRVASPRQAAEMLKITAG